MQLFRFLPIIAVTAIAPLSIAFAQESPSDAGQLGEGDGSVEAPPVDDPEGAPATRPSKLVVATKAAPPFSLKNTDGTWTGLSIELWRRIADDLDYDFEVIETDIPGMLTGLEEQRVDAAVAALTVTADREKVIDFTHPFFTTGLGIAVKTDQTIGMLGAIYSFFSWQFVRALGALLFVLFIVGVLVWIFERKKNADEFGGSATEGIGAGFWWSAVTMTTVGYGDKSPRTLGGRILALIWMFASVITVSGFTAAIASALTVSQLGTTVNGPEDLPRVRVGSITNTTSAAYLRQARIEFQSFDTPAAGLQALADDEIEAMVYDAPILRYFVNQRQEGQLRVLGQTFERQDYAIGLQEAAPNREDINRALLDHISSQWWRDMVYEYLGR